MIGFVLGALAGVTLSAYVPAVSEKVLGAVEWVKQLFNKKDK